MYSKRFSIRSIILAAATAALAGCHAGPKPPTVYLEARLMPQPPRPLVKEVAVPVALPQLRRLPAATQPSSTQPAATQPADPQKAIAQAQQAATEHPTPDGFIGAVQTYTYLPGAVYEVIASPGHLTTLALEPGETLLSQAAGDTALWMVGNAQNGSGSEQRTLILIKPLKANIETNLLLSTDKRLYQIDLKSLEGVYHSSVRWTYPREFVQQLENQSRQTQRKQETVIDSSLQLKNLDFGYRIRAEGDKPDWMPQEVFTDGRKTYIAFPKDLAVKDAPPLFVLGQKDQAQLVNYRVRGRYYIVDQVIRQAELRLGQDPQKIVRIERKD